MSVHLYMDVHIPLAITEGLRRRGLDVLTAQQDGAGRLEDEWLLQATLNSGPSGIRVGPAENSGLAQCPSR